MRSSELLHVVSPASLQLQELACHAAESPASSASAASKEGACRNWLTSWNTFAVQGLRLTVHNCCSLPSLSYEFLKQAKVTTVRNQESGHMPQDSNGKFTSKTFREKLQIKQTQSEFKRKALQGRTRAEPEQGLEGPRGQGQGTKPCCCFGKIGKWNNI